MFREYRQDVQAGDEEIMSGFPEDVEYPARQR